MSGILINEGQLLPLVLQLGSGAVAKHVQAKLYNPAGVELAGSPVLLTEIANGLYLNSALTKNSDDFTLAVYRVYDDAGLTIRTFSTDGDQDSQEIFIKNTLTPIVQQLLSLVQGQAVPGAALTVVLDQADLEVRTSSQQIAVYPDQESIDIKLPAQSVEADIEQQQTTIEVDCE